MKEKLRARLSQELEARLTKHGRAMACPMCAFPNFALADGAHVKIIQEQISGLHLGGQSIPSVILICTNCGFLSEHAIGSLMTFDEFKEMNKDEPKEADVKAEEAKPAAEAARAEDGTRG